MKANAELIFLPYGEETQSTMVDVLIRELNDSKWTSFIAAVAFARSSGNIPELVAALNAFAKRGCAIEMTFGANTFAEGEGSDYEAIELLLNELSEHANVKLYLYNEQPNRTFHPKLYLFANANEAALIIGSSNWTQGGLQRNVEVNVLLRLSLDDPEQRAAYEKTVEIYKKYWRETQ
ncbi:MAG TPA: phospholipase D-like domain-containing protein [Verrucomicrobiae bacterium]|nr:phospholipase D-like domain-containing protein [Verrucomicrobiae bacterium]